MTQREIGTRTTNNERRSCASLFGCRDYLALTDFVDRHYKLRELDSNQHDGVQSVASCRWMIPHRCSLETRTVSVEFGEEGSNLRLLVQGQTAYR